MPRSPHLSILRSHRSCSLKNGGVNRALSLEFKL